MPVPGSVATFDLRSQDPHGPFGQPLLSLASGSYPTTASQVAVTSRVAADLGLTVGGTWTTDGITRTVTGIVANPQNLLDEFALVAPGQVTQPRPGDGAVQRARDERDHVSGLLLNGAAVSDAQTLANQNAINPETISIAAAILGMLLIALVSVGGFTVLAQRRLRAIGMLGAQGATQRHIRLVVQANGVATGVAGAVAGFAIGLIGWLLYRPTAQSRTHHEIGTFHLPWTVIIVSMFLALVATYYAASRPSRQISREPVVAALTGRSARAEGDGPPRPAGRDRAPGDLVPAAGRGRRHLRRQRRWRPGQPDAGARRRPHRALRGHRPAGAHLPGGGRLAREAIPVLGAARAARPVQVPVALRPGAGGDRASPR